MPKILRVKDKADLFHKKMPVFDLPMRILLNSKSQHGIGKTSIILNLLLNPEFGYDKIFSGKNIYIVSDNSQDEKLSLLQSYKSIPDANIMKYDEDELMNLYDEIEEKFEEDKDEGNIQHRIILMDDCGYKGGMKRQFGVVAKLASNCRHIATSLIVSSQRLNMTPPTLRSQVTGACFGACSMAELEMIGESFNYMDSKKSFNKLFRKYTADPRSFLCINFTGNDGLYYDRDFQSIKNLD
tara:strand:- start:570 stop:1289 length:720 start_codon:yes stop_codon:yes gene_type:complete